MSAPPGARAAELVERLARGGREAEAYEKRGRSRRIERGAGGELAATAVELGWAVRCGDLKRSFFASGTGELPVDGIWPAPTPHPLWLPDRRPVPAWAAPAGLDAPLASESEARTLLDAVEAELAREAPGARLLAARFEEGSSEAVIASSRGVGARVESRVASLRLEAERGGVRVTVEAAAREARDLRAAALARRIADRLLALEGREAVGSGPLLVAAPLAARLVEALAPWLAGREAASPAGRLGGLGARIGADGVDLVDDGALAGGLLSAPVDGEGVPCAPATLVEAGRFARPLVAWWEAERPEEASGCARRASYRDLPRRAPTHLYLRPDAAVAVGDLLTGIDRGSFLVDAEGGVRVDPASGRFAVEVSGYALAGGRAAGGLGRRRLAGSLASWLTGVRARGRDLAFVAGDGMFGAPTLLVDGLELSS
jgi:PmbA protein